MCYELMKSLMYSLFTCFFPELPSPSPLSLDLFLLPKLLPPNESSPTVSGRPPNRDGPDRVGKKYKI